MKENLPTCNGVPRKNKELVSKNDLVAVVLIVERVMEECCLKENSIINQEILGGNAQWRWS